MTKLKTGTSVKCWKSYEERVDVYWRRTGVCVVLLTEEVGEQLRLVVVHRGHAHGVEAHQAEHRPIESLRLHYLSDEESHASLLLTVISALLAAFYAGAGKTWKGRRHDSGVDLHPGDRPTDFLPSDTFIPPVFLTYCVPHVVLSLLLVQQLRLVVFGFDGRPSPRA